DQALTAAETARTQLTQELNDAKSLLDATIQERESFYSDALKNSERAEEIEKKRNELARERENLRATNEGYQQRVQELEGERNSLESTRKEQASVVEQLTNQVATLEAQRTHLHEELERIRSESNRSVSELREQL